jgi:hypothetical protein
VIAQEVTADTVLRTDVSKGRQMAQRARRVL